MCDDTQNLNETESETFFRYQILPIPNPILFPIPNIFNTKSDTFFDTKIFRYRIRNHLKNGKVSKPRSFKTEMSHSAFVSFKSSKKLNSIEKPQHRERHSLCLPQVSGSGMDRILWEDTIDIMGTE